MKLWFDDKRDAPDDTWTIARTVEQAKVHLLGGQVKESSLDHDLGDPPCDVCNGVCDKPCPHGCHAIRNDGTALVLWMIENNTWPAEKPKIHSANTPKHIWMREMIDRYGPYFKETDGTS